MEVDDRFRQVLVPPPVGAQQGFEGRFISEDRVDLAMVDGTNRRLPLTVLHVRRRWAFATNPASAIAATRRAEGWVPTAAQNAPMLDKIGA